MTNGPEGPFVILRSAYASGCRMRLCVQLAPPTEYQPSPMS